MTTTNKSPIDNLRPLSLDSFIGQDKIKNVLTININGANARNEPIRHSLFVGPPGLGKTTLANIVAEETHRDLLVASGTSITRIPTLVTLLNQLAEDGGVLFIDEIHRLPRVVEEALYTVMEDYRIDVTTDKLHINVKLPKFTLVGATTRQGLITKPLQDRFAQTYHLSFYTLEELARVVMRSATISRLVVDELAAQEIAKRAKRTPRIANNLLLQTRDFAIQYGIEQINHAVVLGMMEALEIDELGLIEMDRTILHTIIDKFSGGPVGLNTLAAVLIEEQDVLERVYEPYLIQTRLLERTPRGRIATKLAYKHLGLTPPANGSPMTDPELSDE